MSDLLFRGIFTIAAVFGMTWYLLGFRALSAFIFPFLLIIYFIAMGFVSSKLRSWTAKVADERLSLMRAIVYGIRTVKMYAWEWPFMENVQRKRRYDVSRTMSSCR